MGTVTTFADTSGLFAALDADDENHERAREAWASLLQNEEMLLTTNYVLVEAFALVQHRLGMDALHVFVNDVVPMLRTEWITEEDHGAAVQAVLAAGQRRLSLVDCASFAVMRRLGLEEAFAFDRHFRQHGFRTVPWQEGAL
jgi:predicted nucleic acid-binding protein